LEKRKGQRVTIANFLMLDKEGTWFFLLGGSKWSAKEERINVQHGFDTAGGM